MKVKLPKRLIKALGLRPGDYIKLVVDKDGNGIVVEGTGKVHYVDYTDEELKELWEALEEVKGMWADRDDIGDSREYIRRLRQEWDKAWRKRMKRMFGEEWEK
ncbi:MAG: AbrB/MazE/SpoVT family DNA-binding domain-containing protein [Armatimonadetes bacterium]|nr:AbrB/MazE/SpoVT family DNA-binding domain-containing protein [Armatimonadota bacterium]MDW8025998.1 AbrB/MazE/SpoVT family DNA-binding domain-containing protein [Armatimonadota bacterium]